MNTNLIPLTLEALPNLSDDHLLDWAALKLRQREFPTFLTEAGFDRFCRFMQDLVMKETSGKLAVQLLATDRPNHELYSGDDWIATTYTYSLASDGEKVGFGVEAEYSPTTDDRPLAQRPGLKNIPILGLLWSHVQWETAGRAGATQYLHN